MLFESILIAVHIAAVVVWIGALGAIGVIATEATQDARARGTLARRVYLKLAVPGFLIATVAGVLRLILRWRDVYAHAPWMHSKLTLALLLVALHHVVGARARKMSTDGVTPGPIGPLIAVALGAGAAIIVFVRLRPF